MVARPTSQTPASGRRGRVSGPGRICPFVGFVPDVGMCAPGLRSVPRRSPGRRDGKVIMETYGRLDAFLETVIAMNGTDLLITTNSVPLVRLEGTLRPVESLPLVDTDLMSELLAAALAGDQ